MLVFGTRPEAIKMCPLVKELHKRLEEFKTIVWTDSGYVNCFRTIQIVASISLHAIFKSDDSKHSTSDQKEIIKTLDDINKILTEMSSYYKAINIKHSTHHCRFLSMEQLYFLIRKFNSNDELFANITGSCASFGTQNFWNEYVVMHRSSSI